MGEGELVTPGERSLRWYWGRYEFVTFEGEICGVMKNIRIEGGCLCGSYIPLPYLCQWTSIIS